MNKPFPLRSSSLAAAAVVALALSGSVFAQSSGGAGSAGAPMGTASGAGSSTMSTTATPAPMTTRATKAPHGGMMRSDSSFMKQASENGHLEIDASKIALTKATSPQVKEYAQKMIDEHTKVGDELTALAKTKDVDVPMAPSIVQKTKMEVLDHSKGANFDRRYVDSIGVKAHEQTIALFQKAANGAKDPEVKAWAAKTLPSLQEHLDMAKKLQSSMVASK